MSVSPYRVRFVIRAIVLDARMPFTVPSNYGLAYYARYGSVHLEDRGLGLGPRYKAFFYKRNFTGQATELTTGEDPVNLESPNDISIGLILTCTPATPFS